MVLGGGITCVVYWRQSGRDCCLDQLCSLPPLSCTGVWCSSSSSLSIPPLQQEEWEEESVQQPDQTGGRWIILLCVRMSTKYSVDSVRLSSRGCAPYSCRRGWWRGRSGSAGSTGMPTARMATEKSVKLGEYLPFNRKLNFILLNCQLLLPLLHCDEDRGGGGGPACLQDGEDRQLFW